MRNATTLAAIALGLAYVIGQFGGLSAPPAWTVAMTP